VKKAPSHPYTCSELQHGFEPSTLCRAWFGSRRSAVTSGSRGDVGLLYCFGWEELQGGWHHMRRLSLSMGALRDACVRLVPLAPTRHDVLFSFLPTLFSSISIPLSPFFLQRHLQSLPPHTHVAAAMVNLVGLGVFRPEHVEETTSAALCRSLPMRRPLLCHSPREAASTLRLAGPGALRRTTGRPPLHRRSTGGHPQAVAPHRAAAPCGWKLAGEGYVCPPLPAGGSSPATR
jgi:hypothetical protein